MDSWTRLPLSPQPPSCCAVCYSLRSSNVSLLLAPHTHSPCLLVHVSSHHFFFFCDCYSFLGVERFLHILFHVLLHCLTQHNTFSSIITIFKSKIPMTASFLYSHWIYCFHCFDGKRHIQEYPCAYSFLHFRLF